MDKKICVVSMSVGKPASMTAAWINNELIMAERTSYPERRRDMELQLLRELREKEEKGFIVLVEEENSFITGREGQRVRLRDPFMNGRPVLIEAMQIYKELERQKAISYRARNPANTFSTKASSIPNTIKKAMNFSTSTGAK